MNVRVTDRYETQTFYFVDQPFGSPFNTVWQRLIIRRKCVSIEINQAMIILHKHLAYSSSSRNIFIHSWIYERVNDVLKDEVCNRDDDGFSTYLSIYQHAGKSSLNP